jgi:hypothetical protein
MARLSDNDSEEKLGSRPPRPRAGCWAPKERNSSTGFAADTAVRTG